MNTNIALNQLAVAFFLLVNLVIGLNASRGLKTFADYTNKNKKLGLVVLIATLVATLFDAGNIGIKVTYNIGITSLVFPLSFSLMVMLLGNFLLPRLANFPNSLTLTEVMGKIYGSQSKILTAVVCTVFSIGIMVAQLVAFGNLGSMLNINPTHAILIFGLTVTLYTYLGGTRSVAKTDVVQLIAIFVGIAVFTATIVIQAGGLNALLKAVPPNAQHLTFLPQETLTTRISTAFFWSIFPTMIISPPIVQRVLMHKQHQRISSMFITFGITYSLLRLLICVASLRHFTTINRAAIVGTPSLGFLITALCQSHVAQACFLVALFGIMMSTMDSFLNALAIIWVHDVDMITSRKKGNQLNAVRWITLGIGLLCTLAALPLYRSESLNLIGYVTIIISPIALPFLFGLAGLKGTPQTFRVAFFSFVLTMLLGLLGYIMKVGVCVDYVGFVQENIYQKVFAGYLNTSNFLVLQCFWLLAIPVSLFSFLTAHYVSLGAFRWVDFDDQEWKETASYRLSDFFQWFYHPIKWSNQKLVRYGAYPSAIGFFTMAYCLFPMLSDVTDDGSTYLMVWLLRTLPIALCALMMTEQHWDPQYKKYFGVVYYVTIFYSHPFLTTITALSDPQGYVTLVYVVAGLLFLGMMVDWNSFVLLNLLGFVSGLLLHRTWSGHWWADFGNNGGLKLFVAIFFPILFIAVYMRRMRENMATFLLEKKHFEEAKRVQLINYEENVQQIYQTLHKKSSMMKTLDNIASELKAEGKQAYHAGITSVISHFYSMSQRSKEYLFLDIKSVALGSILDAARQEVVQKGLEPLDMKLKMREPMHERQTITCDDGYMITVMVNGLMFLEKQGIDEEIKLFFDAAWLDYDLEPPYAKKPERALRITITNGKAPTSSLQRYAPYEETQPIRHFGHVEIIENKRIIKAHYGFLNMERSGNTVTQTYVIPLDLKSVRPKIVKFASEDIMGTTQLDQKVDVAFLNSAKKKQLDTKRLALALRTAKYYHRTQKRNSGQPYYLHPLAVATILLDYTQEEDTIVGALLHDTLEDTACSIHQIAAIFGDNVARIVGQVTHLYSQENRPKIKLGTASTLERLIEAGNLDALMVKLIDRLHNMRTIAGKKDPQKRVSIAQETAEIFIPMAHQLKLKPVEKELRQLVAAVLQRKPKA